MVVPLAANNHDKWSDAESNGGNEVTEVKSNVSLGVNHGNLTNESANIDEKVEPVVSSRESDSWIDVDTFAVLLSSDMWPGWNLFSDKRADIWLETTGSNTHDDETDNKCSHGIVRVCNDSRSRRSSEDNMTDDCNEDGNHNGLVT